jgi:hypothetical protein
VASEDTVALSLSKSKLQKATSASPRIFLQSNRYSSRHTIAAPKQNLFKFNFPSLLLLNYHDYIWYELLHYSHVFIFLPNLVWPLRVKISYPGHHSCPLSLRLPAPSCIIRTATGTYPKPFLTGPGKRVPNCPFLQSYTLPSQQ